jgi:hypothetical protein
MKGVTVSIWETITCMAAFVSQSRAIAFAQDLENHSISVK